MNFRLTATLTMAMLACAVSFSAPAQQSRAMPVIGYLDGLSPAQSALNREAFKEGLRELGWIEGKNVRIEYRSAQGNPERYAELAGELVKMNVNVILAGGESLIEAARKATSTIPIVMAVVGDPVGAGFVKTLSRPGGNITGMANLVVGLSGKWLELLHETAPRITRVAVLRNSRNPTHDRIQREAETSAASLGMRTVAVAYAGPDDIDDAFARIAREKASAVLVLPDPIVNSQIARVGEICLKRRLPAVHLFREGAVTGGLMSYGPSRRDNYRRAATHVDKILKGARPADIPVEQPTRFELVINMKTAKALGITVPRSVLIRADEVIE